MDGSASFYGELFGWTAQETGPVEQTGGYRIFFKDGHSVAGLAPKMNEQQPEIWTTYVSVADAAETAERVTAAGGQVLFGPMTVMAQGTMAIFVDTVGAMFAVWQPDKHTGAELVNEIGALSWNELACRDIEGAKAFYSAVFGWDGVTADMAGVSYTQWMLDGAPVGGMFEMDENFPEGVPANWIAYFVVGDTDAALTRIGELGGAVRMAAMDLPVGRIGVAADPRGAVFAVIALAPGASS